MGRRRTPTAKERWGPLVIVLCNGSGDLVRKIRAHHLNVMHFDLSQGLGGDYTSKSLRSRKLRLIRAGAVVSVVATPSRLTAVEAKSLAAILQYSVDRDIPVTVLGQADLAWWLGPVGRSIDNDFSESFYLDSCCYGTNWKSRWRITGFRTLGLEKLSVGCSSNSFCKFLGQTHVRLYESTSTGRLLMRKSLEPHPRLCHKLAAIISDSILAPILTTALLNRSGRIVRDCAL
jgi:hypothetical protein